MKRQILGVLCILGLLVFSAFPSVVCSEQHPSTEGKTVFKDTVAIDGVAGVFITTDPWMDLRAYGATGDGVTVDRATLQTALDSAYARSMSAYLPSGTYIIDDTLTTKVSIYGSGWDAILKSNSPDDLVILKVETTEGIVLKDFAMQGSDVSAAWAHKGIFVGSATSPDHLTIDHILITGPIAGTGFDYGIYLEDIQHATIKNCKFRRIQGSGDQLAILLISTKTDGDSTASADSLILPATGDNFRITGTTNITQIDETTNSNTEPVITLAFAGALTVVHGDSLALLDSTDYSTTAELEWNYPHDFIILEKTDTNVWSQVAYHPNTCNSNKILNNDIEFETTDVDAEKQGYVGIALRNGGSFNEIKGNRIKGATGAQISILSTRTFLDACRQNKISDNELIETDGKTASPHDSLEAAIEVGGRAVDNIISGNTIWRSQRIGILVGEDGTNSSCRRNIIEGNNIYMSTNHGIWIRGADESIIKGNLLYENGTMGSGAYDGIQIISLPTTGGEASNNLVIGNYCIGSTYQRYGINILPSNGQLTDGTTIIGNIVPANVTGTINDEGTNTKWAMNVTDELLRDIVPRAIAEGDSVLGKRVFDAGDSTLKVWDGTAWQNTFPKLFSDSTVTADTDFGAILPAGYYIDAIMFKNTTANAIDATFCVGFSAGGQEIVADVAVGADAEGSFTILQRVADFDAADHIFVDADDWNSANLIIWIKMCKMF